jgi:hypothetical protein
MEPTTTAAGAASTSVGFMALMVGYFGAVGADVMMVILAALSGCVISLSNEEKTSVLNTLKFLLLSVSVSLVMAWMLSDLIADRIPALKTPYTPSIIAMFIGFSANHLPSILKTVLKKAESKLLSEEK